MSSVSIHAALCTSFYSRIKGLLRTNRDHGVICIYPCHAIHTFGMSYPIDVCFCDSSLVVIKTIKALKPGKRASCQGSMCVIERPAIDKPWLKVGDVVSLNISSFN